MSEWDQAIAAGLDFGHAWHVFVAWLRRRCPDFEYIVIVHRRPGAIRHDYHVISKGSDKLPLHEIEAKWQEMYLSPTGGLAEIKKPEQAMKYVAGYVSDREKFVRSFDGQGWIFRGWEGFNRRYLKLYGKYPSAELMARSSGMDRENQKGCMWGYLNDGWFFAHRYRERWGELPCERDLMELLKLPKEVRKWTMEVMLAAGCCLR